MSDKTSHDTEWKPMEFIDFDDNSEHGAAAAKLLESEHGYVKNDPIKLLSVSKKGIIVTYTKMVELPPDKAQELLSLWWDSKSNLS
ncbi:hypothetical protein EJ419_07260 [Alloscardovia theropitheci]|uniref:Uncharacterized protein n=1 Tax=Alloscardovia theropitheci TaxID=2496842 RepID=A0A4R0QUP8_9BIFI|nr:hypothetical protein [Alloscardovia theropitheci]TCD53757.1 hypothetical protein EJ419_07260 [Alloscardovia theropitheci]